MDADLTRATNTVVAGIQSSRPVELGPAFCPTEWACNATGEWPALWQEEERRSRSGTLPPALGQAARSWRGPLWFQPIHIDPRALDNGAKRRTQARHLLIERVYDPMWARTPEKRGQKAARSSRRKTWRRSLLSGNSL